MNDSYKLFVYYTVDVSVLPGGILDEYWRSNLLLAFKPRHSDLPGFFLLYEAINSLISEVNQLMARNKNAILMKRE